MDWTQLIIFLVQLGYTTVEQIMHAGKTAGLSDEQLNVLIDAIMADAADRKKQADQEAGGN